ncbi:MAG: hypothetical protein ACLPWS_13670 [Rhodomicrobium sp.]
MVRLKLPFSSTVKFGIALGAIVLAAAFLAPEARSEGASLSGSWSGGGTVLYSDGHRERARCRAHFSQSGPNVSVEALCATPSGSVEQSARLRRVGANSYSGRFYNPQFNITGNIHITVHGNTQSVSLSSGNGSASLTLRH